MTRIRTIKPEFFRHEALFDEEVRTKLPLRLAFIGLWTCCDREGRFRWRARSLKCDILPYDDTVDFANVLDSLQDGGFIDRYEHEGNVYGVIPSWPKHQRVNAREAKSVIPAPPSKKGNAPETRVPTPKETPDNKKEAAFNAYTRVAQNSGSFSSTPREDDAQASTQKAAHHASSFQNKPQKKSDVNPCVSPETVPQAQGHAGEAPQKKRKDEASLWVRSLVTSDHASEPDPSLLTPKTCAALAMNAHGNVTATEEAKGASPTAFRQPATKENRQKPDPNQQVARLHEAYKARQAKEKNEEERGAKAQPLAKDRLLNVSEAEVEVETETKASFCHDADDNRCLPPSPMPSARTRTTAMPSLGATRTTTEPFLHTKGVPFTAPSATFTSCLEKREGQPTHLQDYLKRGVDVLSNEDGIKPLSAVTSAVLQREQDKPSPEETSMRAILPLPTLPSHPMTRQEHVAFIFNYWKTATGYHAAKHDSARTRWIERALQQGYSVLAVCTAIAGCCKTPFNQGDNDRGQRYDGLHLILRDAEHIERFIQHYHHPPQPTSAKRWDVAKEALQSWLTEKSGAWEGTYGVS